MRSTFCSKLMYIYSMLMYDFLYYCSFRIKFSYKNAFEMLDLNDVNKDGGLGLRQ